MEALQHLPAGAVTVDAELIADVIAEILQFEEITLDFNGRQVTPNSMGLGDAAVSLYQAAFGSVCQPNDEPAPLFAELEAVGEQRARAFLGKRETLEGDLSDAS